MQTTNFLGCAHRRGLRRYKDLNGDGKVDAVNDREILGNANPKFLEV